MLSVKDNHSDLKAEIADYVNDASLQKTMLKTTKTEKNRGRIDTRTAYFGLYNIFNIDWDSDIKKLKNTDFPIFSDLYDLLSKKAKNIGDEEHKKLALLFHDNAHGSDQFLWNGHFTIETHSRCVCLDIHSLQNTYLMIDENVPQCLVFLRNVEKRARKYEAGLIIISHSVERTRAVCYWFKAVVC